MIFYLLILCSIQSACFAGERIEIKPLHSCADNVDVRGRCGIFLEAFYAKASQAYDEAARKQYVLITKNQTEITQENRKVNVEFKEKLIQIFQDLYKQQYPDWPHHQATLHAVAEEYRKEFLTTKINTPSGCCSIL